MVKFGRRMTANRSPQYPPDAYMDYDKLKDIIKELGKKKLARWVLYQGGWESIACGELLGICNDLLSEGIICCIILSETAQFCREKSLFYIFVSIQLKRYCYPHTPTQHHTYTQSRLHHARGLTNRPTPHKRRRTNINHRRIHRRGLLLLHRRPACQGWGVYIKAGDGIEERYIQFGNGGEWCQGGGQCGGGWKV